MQVKKLNTEGAGGQSPPARGDRGAKPPAIKKTFPPKTVG